MKPSILFLDIDGVLNHAGTEGPRASALLGTDDERVRLSKAWFEPLLVAQLNRVITLTGCEIVIHSSWRHLYTEDLLRRVLQTVQICGPVLGVTDPRIQDRAGSIRDWLYRHDHHKASISFAVLDDDGPWHCPIVSPRHVQTNPITGLTFHDGDRVLGLLEAP